MAAENEVVEIGWIGCHWSSVCHEGGDLKIIRLWIGNHRRRRRRHHHHHHSRRHRRRHHHHHHSRRHRRRHHHHHHHHHSRRHLINFIVIVTYYQIKCQIRLNHFKSQSTRSCNHPPFTPLLPPPKKIIK